MKNKKKNISLQQSIKKLQTFLEEKIAIVTFPKQNELLNKRSELNSKFLLRVLKIENRKE